MPVRLPPEITEEIQAWADEHRVTRSEAMRRLIVEALAGKQKAKK